MTRSGPKTAGKSQATWHYNCWSWYQRLSAMKTRLTSTHQNFHSGGTNLSLYMAITHWTKAIQS